MRLAPLLLAVVSSLAVAGPTAGAQADIWQPSAGHRQVRIWPGAPPDAPSGAGQRAETMRKVTPPVAGRPWYEVDDVSTPTMTVYSPRRSTGVAIVVFPGGGYQILAIDLEGTEVCDWLTSRGITCVLLKYRVPRSGTMWDDTCQCYFHPRAPLALQDAQRTISLVRADAAAWHIDPHRIGVLGFSAGGHLVAAVSTHFGQRSYRAVDVADGQSSRPDFAIALYPGHLWAGEGSRLNPDIRVTMRTPPTFLVQAEDDPVDDVRNSIAYGAALRKAGVPVEMHLFAHGGHAFGLRRTNQPITGWPQSAERWLQKIGVMPRIEPK